MITTIGAFWDLYEHELAVSVAKTPTDYALRPGAETPESYARQIRGIFQREAAKHAGLGTINLDSSTFKRVARQFGIVKYSQKALKAVYAALTVDAGAGGVS